MANKKIPIISGLTNARNRTLVIALGVVIVGSLIFAATQLTQDSDDPLSKAGTRTGGVPGIRSVPGAKAPEKYVELQREENVKRAEEALKKKTASIPTLIGAIKEDPRETIPIDLEAIDPALPPGQAQTKTGNVQLGEAQAGTIITSGPFRAQKEREQRRAEIEKRRQEQIDRIERQKQEQRRREEEKKVTQQQQMEAKQYEATVKRIKGNMTKYLSGAHKEWSSYPKQNYVEGRWFKEEYKSKVARLLSKQEDGSTQLVGTMPDGSGNPQAITASQQRPGAPTLPQDIIKAGTILFGVLDTAINTDEPGPVLATIVHGKYKGGKLIGEIAHSPRQEKALISFKTMTLPHLPSSMGVSVVAIDPDTARTAVASDVDKHYLLRFGSLFASSFIQGYADAISEQGTVTTVSPLTGATTQTKPELSGKEEFLTALGEVGKQWGAQIRPLYNKPYTITVKQGTGLGLLFTADANVTAKN